jgi:ABC-2 type transport system ATP-binding protein
MINVRNLIKQYGDTIAVNNISFEIEKGTVLGFLGPNGAGKTTTVRIITCYLSPTSGIVTVDGHDVSTDSLEVRRRIGYLPENTPLYMDMNVIDFIKFMHKMRGQDRATSKRISEVVEICGLEKVVAKNVSELSKGFRQRVGLAQALVHDPDILILDEPTVGLDPNQIIEIRNLIKTLGEEKTVVLCSHILPEVEATCNRVLIISDGNIVADGTPGQLRGSFEGKGRLSVLVKNNYDSFLENVSRLESVEKVTLKDKPTEESYELDFEIVKGADPREEIFNICKNNDTILLGMKLEETSLEDIFRRLTGKEQEQ